MHVEDYDKFVLDVQGLYPPVLRINKTHSFDHRLKIVQYSRWGTVSWLDHTITGPLYS